MAELVAIPIIAGLIKVFGFALAIWALIYMIKKAISEWKNSPKNAIDEIVFTVIIIAVTAFVVFTSDGLTTVGSIIDSILSLLVKLLEMIIEYIGSLF